MRRIEVLMNSDLCVSTARPPMKVVLCRLERLLVSSKKHFLRVVNLVGSTGVSGWLKVNNNLAPDTIPMTVSVRRGRPANHGTSLPAYAVAFRDIRGVGWMVNNRDVNGGR